MVREARRALTDGQSRLVRLAPEGGGSGRRADGVVEEVMTCHSGGTLEIHVEPHLPAPALWVVGATPIAAALVELGAAAGFRVSLLDAAAAAADHPAASRVLAETDLAAFEPEARPYAVVASQGQWDEEALRGLLRRGCAYVGLIASPKRAASVRAWLRDEGIGEDRLAALRAPAGLDIGAETPEEIALSILAELTQVRHGRLPAAAALVGSAPSASAASASAAPAGPARAASVPPPNPGPAGPAADIILRDPVCGMTVEAEDLRYTAEHDGVMYAFCCIGCQTRFNRDPASFVAPATS